MKFLSLHQNIFAWLRIFSFTNKTSRKIQCLSKAVVIFVLCFEILLIVASAVYFLNNVFTKSGHDFGLSFYAAAQMAGWGSTFYTLIIAYIVRDKLQSIFDRIQAIYDG